MSKQPLAHPFPPTSSVPRKSTSTLPVVNVCCRCGGQHIRRVKNRIGNGSYQVFDLCLACERNARGNGISLPHYQVEALDLIPLYQDYTKDSPVCEVCGSMEGTELHHFAPQHIFKTEAEKWPKSYLCKKCHDEWHIRIAAHFAEGSCRYCLGLSVKEVCYANV